MPTTTARFFDPPTPHWTQSPVRNRGGTWSSGIFARRIGSSRPGEGARQGVQVGPHHLVEQAGESGARPPPPADLGDSQNDCTTEDRGVVVVVGDCVPPDVEPLQILPP